VIKERDYLRPTKHNQLQRSLHAFECDVVHLPRGTKRVRGDGHLCVPSVLAVEKNLFGEF